MKRWDWSTRVLDIRGLFLFVGRKHLHLFCFLLQCLNLTQLLDYYGLSPHSLISPSQFTYLCPALLYQIDSRVCIRHYHQMNVEQEASENISAGKKLVSTWSMNGLSETEATTGNINSVDQKKKKIFQQMYFIQWPNGALLLNRKNMF